MHRLAALWVLLEGHEIHARRAAHEAVARNVSSLAEQVRGAYIGFTLPSRCGD